MAKKISDDDKTLFRETMKDVTPIDNPRIKRTKPRLNANLTQIQPEYENHKLTLGLEQPVQLDDSLYFARKGVQAQQLKRLRQGKLPCQAEYDLHGLTLNQARIMLERVIYESREYGLRHIRIIHGKGYGSKNKRPVLKNFINQALREFSDVLAFSSAQNKDGGLGAVYVLLRRCD